MPTAPPTTCHCGGLRYAGQPCQRCGQGGKRGVERKASDKQRGSAAKRGYGWWWRNENGTGAADQFLKENPLCVQCSKEGRVEAATVVDHIIPHRGDAELLRDPANWQGLCKRHHNEKTARGE